MPKKKTHNGAKKRFKITGTGKVLRQQTGMRHKFECKSSRKTRALSTGRRAVPGRRQEGARACSACS